ncbi:holo-[acyl-carrier-protein] synthase [Reichenbachiella sp. 5M10]|uniref:holo-ACP synthase n=1 Tax=Reichenbachiella sp. 5M10 TaxID=1889772 RepID=UPI000C147E36|nr:holo-ACP synthase [Reichenbachiella sp. 5M10]PIB36186.1 holo-[acyl-carrier-protein] synthase [Reichenbachiella sp. 5M10]
MILGIGTDLVETARLARRLDDRQFLETVFTSAEIKYCLSKGHPEQHLAARFAAKEAYMKALGTGWSKHADFKEIEVQNSPEGGPLIVLSGATKRYFDKSELKDIFVSLSHTSQHAVAYIIITK